MIMSDHGDGNHESMSDSDQMKEDDSQRPPTGTPEHLVNTAATTEASFWIRVSKKTQIRLPESITALLSELGYNNEAGLRTFNDENITKIESFARRILSKKLTSPKKEQIFGIFSDIPEEFEILPGHRELLLEVARKMKDSSKILINPAGGKTCCHDKVKEPIPKEDLTETESILSNINDKALVRDFNLNVDKTKPNYILSLSNEATGTILCQIEECKNRNHLISITRSSKRPWSSQNFYRHVRAAHFTPDAKKAKTTDGTSESTNPINISDDEIDQEQNKSTNSSNKNKWKQPTYSRSERNQRRLQVAALNNRRMKEFWPVINQIEKTIRENEELHATVRLLLERLKDTKEAPPPTVSAFLQVLIDSALSNADKKQGGERYKEVLRLMATHFFLLCGTRAYVDLQGNLKKVFPSLSAVLYTMKQNKQVIVEGQFRWDELADFLDKRGYTREIVVQEDATRCISCVKYDSSSNQLVGLVLPLNREGMPVVQSFPATTEKEIRNHFQTGTLARYLYFILARPLQDTASCFVLCGFGSDNKFDTLQVSARWEDMLEESAKRQIRIRAFATDGDPRCLAAMKSVMFSPCQNPLAWHFWFRADINRNQVCVQDPTHVATKLRNLLLRRNILCIGDFFVSVSHIKFMMERVSKDHHQLTDGDLNPSDRMNYRSAEKLFSETTTSLLSDTPDTAGTSAFLSMGRNVTEAFLSRQLQPAQRIRMVWTALFFYRGWRQWVMNHPDYNLTKNFLTTNCYICVEINAHALILLVRFFRDNQHTLELGEFAPWLWSSQECEALFRLLRSMTSTMWTVINFSVWECLQKLSRVALEESIRKQLGSTFFFAPTRREGKKRAETLTDVNFPSDAEIVEIVKEARSDAQGMLANLGVHSGVPTVFSSIPEVEPIDSDNESDDEDEIPIDPGQSTSNPPRRSTRAHHFIDEDSNDEESDSQSEGPMVSLFKGAVGLRSFPNAVVTPDGPYVKVKDAYGEDVVVKKSGLVWMLGSRSQLSKDRTTRVRQGEALASGSGTQAARSSDKYPRREDTIAIGDWCAFRDPVPRSRKILIGRVLLLSYLTGKGKQKEYVGSSAPIEAPAKGKKKPRGIGCSMDWFVLDRRGGLTRHHIDGFQDIESNYIATINNPATNEAGNMFLDAATYAYIRKAV